MVKITRKLEFDAGHRIPDHRSQCRNLHGHRYVLEVTLQGDLIKEAGTSERGMVMDFADIKALAVKHLVEKWDHAFIVYRGDLVVHDFLTTLPQHKTVVLDTVPTVENLAATAFQILSGVYNSHYRNNLHLQHLRLYETPNCWADVEAGLCSQP